MKLGTSVDIKPVGIRRLHKTNGGIRAERDHLIEYSQTYVHQIVNRMICRLGLPAHLKDEFVSYGYLGLVEAADRYNQNSGVDFKHYAFLRIRGAVIDGIRSSSELSARAYRAMRAIEGSHAAHDEAPIPTAKQRERPPASAIARIFDLTAQSALAYRLAHLQEQCSADPTGIESANPEIRLGNKQEQKLLRRLVQELPPKEKRIIEQFYFQGRSFTEICQTDKMGKSWVSRLHARALISLGRKLKKL